LVALAVELFDVFNFARAPAAVSNRRIEPEFATELVQRALQVGAGVGAGLIIAACPAAASALFRRP
jgi:hypothetical protein